MCTAAAFTKNDFYFGRNLDYEMSYGENVVITPRNFGFSFNHAGKLNSHYAILGMAHIDGDYPLYYDGVNEKGLAMAGLNFVGNAFYGEPVAGKTAIAPHEFIAYILGNCADLTEARKLLDTMTLVGEPFSEKYPISQLHWMISDNSGSVVVESTKKGFNVYDNPIGVLTNNPEFPEQLTNLTEYMGLSPKQPANTFCGEYPLKPFSRGMGAVGLPGDLSSRSRFVRAAFVRGNSKCGDSEEECVSQFFHILHSVENQRGCCELGDNVYEITIYTSCCNCDKGIYYYTTYNNHRINAVNMHNTDLDGSELVKFDLRDTEEINYRN